MIDNIITVTEMGVYKRCRRMWDYQYQQRLVPLREAPYFFAGRLVHMTLADWTEHSDYDISQIWSNTVDREIQHYKTRYDEVVGALPSRAELDEVMANAYVPFCMTQNYKDFWESPLPEGFKLIQSEQTCIVDIPNTDMRLEGTLDGLVIDESTGALYVLERKTYEQRPRIETLETNEQFTAYAWIISKLFSEYRLGGILYDGLWKRTTPPNKRTMRDLFFRHLILKSQHELDHFEANLIRIANEMQSGPAIYPNRVWQGCWDDKSYERLCWAETKGEDIEEIKNFDYGVREHAKWFDSNDDE